MFWEVVMIILDPSVSLINGLRLKGRFADKQSVEHDSYSPNVHFEAVTSFIEDLRRNVIRRTTGRIPALSC